VLPTPDPTIASCISDEDVARQLIALGDASNFSLGRTSASTLDDAFSGAADVASSTGATSDSEDYTDVDMEGLPRLRQAVRSHSRDDVADRTYENDQVIKSEELDGSDGPPKAKKIKTKTIDAIPQGSRPSLSAGKSPLPKRPRLAATLPR
jgi:hypothetical protein